jgi:hypothetical protein
VFDHAIQNAAYEHDNPARWSLYNEALSAPRKLEGRGHLAAMPRADLPGFMKSLRERQPHGMGRSLLSLPFSLPHVLARSGSPAGARSIYKRAFGTSRASE